MKSMDTIRQLIEGARKAEQVTISTLHLTAYENRLSLTARQFLSSELSFRQHEGTPFLRDFDEAVVDSPGFIYKAYPELFALEAAAYAAANTLFSAQLCDLRPLSGLHAMICVLGSCLKPGDTVFSFAPQHGGHAATRTVVERFGAKSLFLPISPESHEIDFGQLEQLVRGGDNLIFYFDHGVPLNPVPVARVREEYPLALMIYDGAHTLGLIAGRVFQNPLAEGADVLLGNTHKTFPGAQKGLICYRDGDLGERTSEVVSHFISNQQGHHALANYVTMLEMANWGSDYGRQIQANAVCLRSALREQGLRVFRMPEETGTTHIVLLTFEGDASGERRLASDLLRSNISVNARIAYGRGVVRLGVQEITRMGAGSEAMQAIAAMVAAVAQKGASAEVAQQASDMVKQHPEVHFSFDQT